MSGASDPEPATPAPSSGGARVISRRRFLAVVTAAVAGIGVATDALLVEPNELSVTRHAIGPVSLPDAPVLRVVQLSDLHLRGIGYHEERIAHAVRALAPKLLVVTGDSIDRPGGLAVLDEFLGLLDDEIPKYAVLGNWEHYSGVSTASLAQVYERHGCRLLVNESIVHDHEGRTVLVTGLDDLIAGEPRMVTALRDVDPQEHHVVLAHCPLQRDYLHGILPRIPGASVDRTPEEGRDALRWFTPSLVLSGHTHGGQVNLLGQCPWRPWGSGPYVRGWYAEREPHLYVSSGLGTVGLPVRFGATPELPCFDWSLAGRRPVTPGVIARAGSAHVET